MMRKIITAILILVVFFYACEKDESSSGPAAPATPAATASFSAKVNGNTVYADTVVAQLNIDTSLGIPFRVLVIAALCDTQTILPGFIDTINSTVPAVGDYSNSPLGFGSLGYYHGSDTINEYFSSTAQFTITTVDAANQKVSGTFSGIVVGDVSGDTIIITDGVFSNIHYEVW